MTEAIEFEIEQSDDKYDEEEEFEEEEEGFKTPSPKKRNEKRLPKQQHQKMSTKNKAVEEEGYVHRRSY